jgi:hypothetical protein
MLQSFELKSMKWAAMPMPRRSSPCRNAIRVSDLILQGGTQ